MTIFRQLLADEHGFIVSTELVVIATLLVVGLIAGLHGIQASVVGEMNDVGAAIGSLNQSYQVAGRTGCRAWGCRMASWTAASRFVDCVDEEAAYVDFGCGYRNDYRGCVPGCTPRSETYVPWRRSDCLNPAADCCDPDVVAPAPVVHPPVTSVDTATCGFPSDVLCATCPGDTSPTSACGTASPCTPCAPTNGRVIW